MRNDEECRVPLVEHGVSGLYVHRAAAQVGHRQVVLQERRRLALDPHFPFDLWSTVLRGAGRYNHPDYPPRCGPTVGEPGKRRICPYGAAELHSQTHDPISFVLTRSNRPAGCGVLRYLSSGAAPPSAAFGSALVGDSDVPASLMYSASMAWTNQMGGAPASVTSSEPVPCATSPRSARSWSGGLPASLAAWGSTLVAMTGSHVPF